MHKLSFCNVTVINTDTVEITFDNGVEINLDMVNEFWDFIETKMPGKISVILNKSTSYSYEFDASIALSESDRIKNIAVVCYDEISATASEYMKKSFNKSGKNIKIFHTKKEALDWLMEPITDKQS
ncbi:MAG: hypothetical protein ACRBBR_04705 [Cellvibrionaceae bacterium]